MGWTCGQLQGPFNSRAAIAFDLGHDFAARVIATARYGTVIYAAVRSTGGADVFGLVLLAERRDGILCTKAISEDMGPTDDRAPARILDLLTQTSDANAREWRERCRARLACGRPQAGQEVHFARAIRFTDGAERRVLTWIGGSRFRDADGALCRIPNWQDLSYRLADHS